MTRLPLAASQSRKPTGENVAVLHGPASLAHKHHLGVRGGWEQTDKHAATEISSLPRQAAEFVES